MSDEYSLVSKGKLKLKTPDVIVKKKKKSKNKDKKALKRTCASLEKDQKDESSGAAVTHNGNAGTERKLTDAEKKFKKQQEKMRQKRIMEMASTTHKQRVEKFNEHLDSLTEHFDIPKVSWTK